MDHYQSILHMPPCHASCRRPATRNWVNCSPSTHRRATTRPNAPAHSPLASASPTLLPMTKRNRTSTQKKITKFVIGQEQQQVPAPHPGGFFNHVTSKTKTTTYDAECQRHQEEQQLLADERQRIVDENERRRLQLGVIFSPLFQGGGTATPNQRLVVQ